MNERTIDAAAVSITEEVGIGVSYFTEPEEMNLLEFAPVLGYLLLQWILEGVADALYEEAHQNVKRASKTLTAKLIRRIKRLFAHEESQKTEDDAKKDTEAALLRARAAAEANSGTDVMAVIEQYEQALFDYLNGEGMPADDALRIAQRVRREAGVQMQLTYSG